MTGRDMLWRVIRADSSERKPFDGANDYCCRCGPMASPKPRCGQCGHDLLFAFPCEGRGVCPSCNC